MSFEASFMAKKKFIKTKSGSYVPESMTVKEENESGVTKSASRHLASDKPSPQNQELPGFVSTADEMRYSDVEEEIPLEKSNKKIFILSLISMIIIISATSLALFSRTKINPSEEGSKVDVDMGEQADTIETKAVEIVAESDSTVDQSPANTDLERSEVRLEILNGSGTSGLAGSIASDFEELGYTNVETGNTTRNDENLLVISKDKEDQLDVVISDTKKLLKINDYETDDLENIDARIVLGVNH